MGKNKEIISNDTDSTDIFAVISKLKAEITEYKSSEAELQQKLAFQNALIESFPVPVYYKNTHGCYIGANKAFLDFYGITEQEMLGKTAYDITTSQLADIYTAKDNELIQNPGQQTFEISMVDFNNVSHDVIFHKSTFLDSNGEVAGIIGVIQDISERKQAELAMRKSEARLREIIENADEIIFTLSSEGVLTFASPAWTRLLGHNVDEVVGSHFCEFIHPDYKDLCAKAIYDTIISGEIHKDVEYLVRHKNGEWRWHTTVSTPLKDETGKVQYIIGIARDVTERKETEAALKAATEELEIFFSYALDLLCIADTDGYFHRLNRQWEKVLGYSIEELEGQRFLDFVHPDDVQPTLHVLSNLASSMEVLNFVNRYRCKDGSYRWIEWRSIPVGNKIYAAARDITNRKQAEEALRQSEKKYRSVIENIQDVFYRADLNGNLLMGSPSGVKMFGYDSVDDMIGLPLWSLWVDPSNRQKMISLVSENNTVKDFEAQLKRKDGSTFVAAFTTHFFYDDDGNRLGTEGIIRDITEQKKTQEEIRQLNEDLEKRVKERTSQLETVIRELEAFSYSVSHDLRAPLRAINGYANILKDEYSPILGDEGNRLCTVINKETQRMSCLIDDLLSFARIGRVELKIRSVDMQALVNSVLPDLVPPDEQERISFQVSQLEPGRGDSNLLRQVWINLISNAIKFTSQREKAIIQINSESNENEVIYSIRDNGAGFDMRYAGSLFGVFNRLHSDKDYEGTGVGLAIVQRIVNRHGGRTWGEGVEGEGATFYFTLPRGSYYHG